MKNYINSFLTSITADGCSVHTIKAYSNDLINFEKYISSYGYSLADINYAILREWCNSLELKGLSASTRSRKITSVKMFFEYLVKINAVQSNPADGLEKPKMPHREPKTITTMDAQQLLDISTDSKTRSHVFFRDYAIIATFLFTGIRREEMTNIKLTDIDLQQQKILIHGKGNKERTVYINETLLAVMSEYISAYRYKFRCATESEYVFVSTKGTQLTPKAINDIVNKHLEAVGVKEHGVSAHTLRKRFATSAFNQTHDIGTISKLLGHSSPTVTTRYVVIDENTMRTATSAVCY